MVNAIVLVWMLGKSLDSKRIKEMHYGRKLLHTVCIISSSVEQTDVPFSSHQTMATVPYKS